MALELARQALEREGFDPELWIPVEEGRTKAPNHVPDMYLVRNTINPNCGRIAFRNEALSGIRYVDVQLKEGKVVCRIWRPL